MGSILKEVRVRGYGQNLDIKVTIEKSGLFNKKRKLYTTFWGKNTSEYEKDKSIYDWGEMEFVLEDLTEDNNFGEYRTYYESYIAARDKPNPFKISNFYQVNNLEFSKEWNTDLDIIKLYILINTEKIKPKIASWALIEDPIKGEKGGVAPYYRSFGNDAYHLNNGAQIYISWTDAQSNLSKGGDSWSDEKGRELKEQDLTKYNTKYLTKDSKGNIDKMVSRVVAPDGNSAGDGILTYDPRSFPVFSKEFKSSQKVYGMVDDINIVNQVISHWKQAVPGYDTLELLKNSNGVPIINMSDLSTVLIEYKSPFGVSASQPVESAVNPSNEIAPVNGGGNTATLFKPTLRGIEDGFQTTAKTDLPNFSIYVGDPDKDWPKVAVGDIPEDGEDFENVDGAEVLDDEYVENEFIGDEETEPLFAELQNAYVQATIAEAEKEAESLPPVDPNDPDPFKSAKGSGIEPSSSGQGYPVDSSTTKFVNKHTNGIYPAKQHKDGTFIISKKEDGDHKDVYKDRHWLVANPQYVKLMAKVEVPLSDGSTSTISVHPEFANKLRTAFKVIKDRGLNKYIFSCAGGLAIRNVTNGRRLSNHSYGFAIDVNSTKRGWEYGAVWDVENKIVKSGGKKYSWGANEEGFYEVVKIMKGYGVGWLGSSDPMHFSLHE